MAGAICKHTDQKWIRHNKMSTGRKLVKLEVPTLEDEHTAHDKRVWEDMKTARILEWNLCNLFIDLMSLCNSDTKKSNRKYKWVS